MELDPAEIEHAPAADGGHRPGEGSCPWTRVPWRRTVSMMACAPIGTSWHLRMRVA